MTGRRDGRLVMVWPLIETNGAFGVKKLAWMGEPVSQYGDALAEPGPLQQATLLAGWQAVRELGADIAVLRKTREDSTVGSLLAMQAVACEAALAPFVRFSDKADFAALSARRPAKARSGRRRLLRRLQETGDVVFASSAAESAALLVRAFNMKREWLRRRGLYSGPIESDAMLAFFLDFAARPQSSATMLVDSVRRDGAPIAVGVTFACKDAGFGHLLSHDPDCDKQGAGILLAWHVMESCFARGLDRYDMLAPYDAYKAEWADDAVAVADYVSGFTPRGKLIARGWTSKARQKFKSALKKMPARFGRIVWPLARRIKEWMR